MKTCDSLLARGLFAASLLLLSSSSLVAADAPQVPSATTAAVQVASAERNANDANASPAADGRANCRWWQFGRCHDDVVPVEGLPREAPRTGTVVTVDLTKNMAYLFQDGELVDKAPAATGSGKILKKGRRIWAFHTPRGRMTVLRKIVDPVWRKPDWAFVEAGEPVPSPDSPKRYVKNHLGKYALDLGDGIMIHGTDEYDSLGRKVSHGCVRLPEDMLTRVYKAAKVGTEVYVFESEQQRQQTAQSQPAESERRTIE